MGIINWMQSRFNGKPEKRRSEAAVVCSARDIHVRESCGQDHAREEKNPNGDWPQGLLSIGTLGNEEAAETEGGPRASQADVPDFTIEEVKKLQDALNKLLRRAKSKSSARGSGATDEDRANQLPLDRFLNCPSSLEVDRRISLKHAADGENGEFSPNTQIILSKARDLLVNSNGATIKQKSFKFLLKKMFVCRGGFEPASSLKDPVESRMEKLFRTMLQKKMNARPSNANAASSRKYYLEDKPSGRMKRDRRLDEEDDKGSDSFKWDKTDSDFIVLEI
ncbi:protein NEGATIVE GRAVITROPIC RESPONSE OF ROOTS-like [Phragmites australis]|uniref:protein NEGATIVE GRAVITROPIC RESPONSE OF ROOTS-like n=1 Tax=Phragmites australis TaxID=29695 RepID=UPI002D78ECC0|nr:protein NEGATIVE GRAVITROPIC RESPONSE OF ROOTS-like [Phragmites australis]